MSDQPPAASRQPPAGQAEAPEEREVRAELQADGKWAWWCTFRGESTGPWPGYHEEGTARAAAACWYPLPKHPVRKRETDQEAAISRDFVEHPDYEDP